MPAWRAAARAAARTSLTGRWVVRATAATSSYSGWTLTTSPSRRGDLHPDVGGRPRRRCGSRGRGRAWRTVDSRTPIVEVSRRRRRRTASRRSGATSTERVCAGPALLHEDRGQPGVGGAGLEQRGEDVRPQPRVEVVDVGLEHDRAASGRPTRPWPVAQDEPHDVGAGVGVAGARRRSPTAATVIGGSGPQRGREGGSRAAPVGVQALAGRRAGVRRERRRSSASDGRDRDGQRAVRRRDPARPERDLGDDDVTQPSRAEVGEARGTRRRRRRSRRGRRPRGSAPRRRRCRAPSASASARRLEDVDGAASRTGVVEGAGASRARDVGPRSGGCVLVGDVDHGLRRGQPAPAHGRRRGTPTGSGPTASTASRDRPRAGRPAPSSAPSSMSPLTRRPTQSSQPITSAPTTGHGCDGAAGLPRDPGGEDPGAEPVVDVDHRRRPARTS